jgi:hypothetical protein
MSKGNVLLQRTLHDIKHWQKFFFFFFIIFFHAWQMSQGKKKGKTKEARRFKI